ncbi:hypothetical protein BN903_55 [Halorubrum sp. AJ67]|nr:hypothetical protein BN903_55 [Halorubrum sp. AJ67]
MEDFNRAIFFKYGSMALLKSSDSDMFGSPCGQYRRLTDRSIQGTHRSLNTIPKNLISRINKMRSVD